VDLNFRFAPLSDASTRVLEKLLLTQSTPTQPDNHVSAIDAAITSRASVRAFTQQTVPRDMLQDILHLASRASSGTNTQPWKVYVLQG
jgi:hypothetical protein